MEDVLLEILDGLRAGQPMDDAQLAQILARRNRQERAPVRAFAKKHVVPFYLKTKAEDPARWASWNVDAALEARLLAALRMKPRRTASGVATITVITKPWPCRGACLFCPNDVRMPKSYLHDEPACQRAERNFFDPYLQVASRLQALQNMGHVTDKVELIVLGGTWCDYPRAYQIWFVEQMFAALNDGDAMAAHASQRRARYERLGLASDPAQLATRVGAWQAAVRAGNATYNDAVRALYGIDSDPARRATAARETPPTQDAGSLAGKSLASDAAPEVSANGIVATLDVAGVSARSDALALSRAWQAASAWQSASLDDLFRQHRANESADHHVVGLVVETRPDAVTPESLKLIRQLGATKVQMGVQSLDEHVLAANGRATGSDAVVRAMDLARLFGFKVHAHFMANLLGATPESDVEDYARFAGPGPYQPDEVKIYPCALVEGTGLNDCFASGTWRPYTEDELLDVLSADVLATPEFTRISRMIRDISAGDIVAGNKKANLRQLVEARVAAMDDHPAIREMRHRELNDCDVDLATLQLREVPYETASTREVFLQWVTPENRLAGFLRLSLPRESAVRGVPGLPIAPGQAMIREVHVYGRVAAIAHDGTAAGDANAQHAGLGRRLVQRACDIAAAEGYRQVNVISAVGTRNYYRSLGFRDASLYQVKDLA